MFSGGFGGFWLFRFCCLLMFFVSYMGFVAIAFSGDLRVCLICCGLW